MLGSENPAKKPAPLDARSVIAVSVLWRLFDAQSRRHATAVSLVTAEVDVTVIRSWLGHESLNTTNIYYLCARQC